MGKISKYLEYVFIPCLSDFYEYHIVLDTIENKNILSKWYRKFSPSKAHKQLWHTFSHNENSAYAGQNAIQKFEKENKNNIYIFSNELVKPLLFNTLINDDISIDIVLVVQEQNKYL